jgi:hypothetical protein
VKETTAKETLRARIGNQARICAICREHGLVHPAVLGKAEEHGAEILLASLIRARIIMELEDAGDRAEWTGSS